MRRLKVGVLVDLMFSPDAGGHVKCWQRLAEAAVACPELLDLTVHFSGPEPRRVPLSPTVRYQLLPPVLSSARLVCNVPDDTDLAPWHPRLARLLPYYDVIHTTDAFFNYARTAMRVAKRRGIPVVSSIHTNTPDYARITVGRLLDCWLGDGLAHRVAAEWLDVPGRVGDFFERRLARYVGSVGAGPSRRIPQLHRGMSLRRGLDRTIFHPRHRDRRWLERRFALPGDHLVALYAGKLNAGKNVPLLMPVIEGARRAGVAVHLLCAGDGAERRMLQARLGAALTCAGSLSQEELARVYASADLFLFPSRIDEFGNAALEALASGLPALVADGSGIAARMADCPGMRVLPGNDPAAWVAAVAEFAANPRRRSAMGHAARAYVEACVPTWREVLEHDLLPAWREAADAGR